MVFVRLLRSLCCVSRVFSSSASPGSFSVKEFRRFPITRIANLNHDSKVLRVGLPSSTPSTNMKVSSLVMVQGKNEGEMRPYTPISLKEELGYFDLLVKSYPDGVVSSYLHSLKVGEEVVVKGPFEKLPYLPNMKKTICFLAGGSGITPCLQVIKEALRLHSEGDTTQLRLLYSNRKEDDILLRGLLDELSNENSNFEVEYTLSQPSPDWKGKSGRINSNVLQDFLPAPSSDILVYICGPPGFMTDICGDKLVNKEQGPVGGALKSLGYTEDMIYKF